MNESEEYRGNFARRLDPSHPYALGSGEGQDVRADRQLKGDTNMGVTLAMERSIQPILPEGLRPPRGRRPGQHARSADDQACLDALAAFLRNDTPGARRCLSRLAKTVLAGRLRPAVVALAEAVDIALTRDMPSGRPVVTELTASPACHNGGGPAGIRSEGTALT
jgi:hypothetical protein